MIKGDKRGVLIAKLSASDEAISKLEKKCRNIWSIIKQVWYVPFIWSLAWFSYWLFQECIALGQPLAQGNPFNILGLFASIAAILAAGYISGKSHKKNLEISGKAGIEDKSSFTLLEASLRSDSQGVLHSQRVVQKAQYDKSEKPESQLGNYTPTETNQINRLNDKHLKPVRPLEIIENSQTQGDQSIQAKKHQEIASECLICPNLTSCDQRKRMTADSKTPCSYARMNQEKNPSGSQQD